MIAHELAENDSVLECNRKQQKYDWVHKKKDARRTDDRLQSMFTLYTNLNNVCF